MDWETLIRQTGRTLQGNRTSLPTTAGPADAPAGDMPEAVLLSQIRAQAKQTGWKLYHTYRSTRSEEGFPDLVLTDGTSILIYELKTNTGKPTAAQAQWLALLAQTGQVETGLWRPRDLPQICRRLERRLA
jgi:hypothetical protein